MKIKLNSDVLKNISKDSYYSEEQFTHDARKWISAIKTGSMLCIIKSVSSSGMSRNMAFNSCEKTKTGCYYRQYLRFLEAIGQRVNYVKYVIVVSGCGMDMVFHTNYTIIHQLHRMGFTNKVDCDKLSQMTPTVL